jgi:hypothetical protein
VALKRGSVPQAASWRIIDAHVLNIKRGESSNQNRWLPGLQFEMRLTTSASRNKSVSPCLFENRLKEPVEKVQAKKPLTSLQEIHHGVFVCCSFKQFNEHAGDAPSALSREGTQTRT